MFDYFDGDFRRRPQQSLGGAHKKVFQYFNYLSIL
jgi:hypothetical protein